MRILLLAPHPFFQQRGTPIAEKVLLEVLAARGHRIDVLTFHEGQDPEIPGCRVHRIPAIPRISGIRPGFSVKKLVCDAVMLAQCLRLVRRHRYDLIHAVEESAFMALAAKWLFRVPYVYDMDSGLTEQMVEKFPALRHAQGGLRWFEKRAVRGSVGVLAVCRAIEDKALEYAPQALVARIEDVTLLAMPGGGGDRLLEMARYDGPVVMYVGNLQHYQGIDLLLDAFRLALSEVPRAHLVVIGGLREDIEHYVGRCRELGIEGSVHFVGPRPLSMLGFYLRQATVLASPRRVGFNTPMKIYSYLDSGRAILATRLPTHTQVLDDDIACLVEPRPEAMAEGMARLLRDEGLRARLAENAKSYAQREFTPQAFEGKLLRFYDAVARRLGTDPAGSDGPPQEAPRERQRRGA